MNLRIPGPTPCPPEVLEAMAGEMVNHRGPEFADLIQRLTSRLQGMFRTRNDLFILTTSGTGALEAMVVNTLSAGDRVLAISIGSFGDRFANIAATYGADVQKLSFEWGQGADPEAVRRALAADPAIVAVLVTHNETSTGVTNDLEAIARVAREFDKLLLVDAVSSLGAIPVETDAWGLDVVATSSQKGWMVPPGLAMVAVSPRAWEAYAKAKMPRFYFDFGRAREYLEKGQTPWTPALSVFYAMDVALAMMEEEGLENVFARHRHLGRRTREGVKALGLRLFADERRASDTVTAVWAPEGVNADELRRLVDQEHQVVLAEGQGKAAGKAFRIGHLGLVSEEDIDQTLTALRQVLSKLGHAMPIGR